MLNPESLIPADHPIRKIWVVVDAVFAELDEVFDEMCASSAAVGSLPALRPGVSGESHRTPGDLA